MDVKAVLDVDMVALESSDKITLMFDLAAPANPLAANRPGQAVQIVLDRSVAARLLPKLVKPLGLSVNLITV